MEDKYRALETYVRHGGKLVICQPAEWQKTLGFGELLPVARIDGVHEKPDLRPLSEMARPIVGTQGSFVAAGLIPSNLVDPFAVVPGPYRFAKAVAKANTVTDWTIEWPADGDTPATTSPYLVRMPAGLGSVTWVAQDLGDPSLAVTKNGWVYVWNQVFDWRNSPIPVTSQTSTLVRQPYREGMPKDVGPSIVGRWMDLQSKSAWLITLAVLFFIGYWLLAGPGVYAFLASRRRTELSWFVYGACAFGATALTVIMYRLVLRGPPELRHLSIARIAPDQPAVVISRMGLYIPRDGTQRIELKDTAPQSVTSISALPIHPAFLKSVPAEAGPEYTVPIVDPTSTEPAHLEFQYRSTLKKFQSTWVGNLKGSIQGSIKLSAPPNLIDGHLTNALDRELRNVFIAFNYVAPTDVEGAEINNGDWIIYVPRWDASVTLDLGRDLFGRDVPLLSTDLGNVPASTRKVRGRIAQEWQPYLLSGLRTGPMNDSYDDSADALHKSFVILSLFDRLAPTRNPPNPQAASVRIDLLRRGARMLDLSQAVSAGSVVILGESDGPLPVPLEVEGEAVGGDGTTLYQFVLPLSRPTAKPATQPAATQPAAE